MIELRKLRDEDIAIIKAWPLYPEEFSDLDYSLRDGGWLDEFLPGTGTELFVATNGETIAGFSLLARESGNRAEFRIALHPEKTGQGIGRRVVFLTLAHGFADPCINTIGLIVRKTNHRAKRLYESLMFRTTGECTEEVQGKMVKFYSMEIDLDTFTGVNM
jgi:diamine N-acetyltransferase